MKKSENIKNKFSDFEPEVDGLSIDKGWEEIKYFVPQKQKKKRFGFFFSPVFYGSFITLLLFGSGAAVLFYYDDTSPVTGQLNNKSVIKNKKPTAYELPLRVITQQYIAKSLYVGKQRQSNTLIFSKEKSQTKNYSHANKTRNYSVDDSQVKNIPAQKNVMSKIGDYIDSPLNTSNTIEQNQNTSSIVAQNNPVLNDSSIMLKTTEALATMQLDSVRSTIDSLSLLKESVIVPEATSRFSVDVFMGTHKTFTTVKDISETIKYNYNTLNFSIGLGVNYRIKNKLYFTSQFTFSENDVAYTKETIENKIVKKPRTAPITAASNDTTYYVTASTKDKIQSNVVYHLGLGLEYQLFQKNKLSLNGFALINARTTKYDYNTLKFYNEDTLLFAQGNSNNSLTNIAPSTFSEENTNASKNTIGIGLTPGFVVAYKLSGNATLIFKPSYFVELYQTKLNVNESSFTLKQNNLFFHLGLRINL
jgi:hypothetical protein